MELDDLKDVIRGMGLHLPEQKSSVLTGSLPNFVAAIERRLGPLKSDPKAVEVGNFMGIKIIEDRRVPSNRALLKQGDEVIAVINLDTPSPQQQEMK